MRLTSKERIKAMPATALSKTTSPVAVLRDPRDTLDMRVAIYHAAFGKRVGYNVDVFTAAMMRVTDKPQLFAINGRPC
jgi:hypothetical protein